MRTIPSPSADGSARRRIGAHPVRRALAGGQLALIAGLLTLACGAGTSSTKPPAPAAVAAAPTTHRVEMQDLLFKPAEVVAAPGDTIVWTNRDFFPHTATDDAGRWDSGTIGPNESWRLVVSEAGSYHCTFHPNMKAAIKLR